MVRSWTDCLTPQDWHDDDYRALFATFQKVHWIKVLGIDVESFPPALRIMICQCFAMNYPAAIFWGPTMIQIYNVAFATTVARESHPEMMGRPWLDTWSSKSSLAVSHHESLVAVMATGKSMLTENELHFVQREDQQEESYYHYNISPIRNGESESLGLFLVLTETTTTFIAQRRQKVIAEVQAARASVYNSAEIFEAIADALEKEPVDFPCVIGYHCKQTSVESSLKTYSRVLCVGASTDNVPTSISMHGAADRRKCPLVKRDLEDYLLEVLHTLRAVKLTDQDIISKFCECRSHGEQTKTVWLSPVFCSDQAVAAGIAVQGLNTRRPQTEDAVIQQFANELQASITNANHRASLTDALKARTAELAVSQKRFEIMAKACPAGIYIINLTTGEFEFVNDAYFEITGVPKEVGISRWSEYVHPDVLEDAMQAWANLVNTPILNYETRWITPWRGDNERWTSSSAIVHQDEAGNNYIFGAFSDASALRYSLKVEKERADTAIKTKKQQLEFLDMIAHELRNPLGAIMQSSDFLIDKLTRGASGDELVPHVVQKDDVEDLRTIVLCSQHMSRIINDTLNLSKLEGGMLIATYVPTQPLAVLKSILAIFDAEAKRSNTELVLEVDQSFSNLEIDWIQTDPSRFSQIVINLLANSIKFVSRMKVRRVVITLAASSTPMETRVTLDRRPSFVHHSSSNASYHLISPTREEMPVYIICRISDTGPGMSEDQVSSLFQRYFQASPKTHVEYGGSGLGLFISKQLVTLLNGNIDVESTKDRGTTFSFSIKTAQCQAPSMAIEPAEAVSESHVAISSTKNIILIAEDNLINQKIMVKQLRNAGYKTLVANNGREAIDLLLEDQKNASEIALCLCDVEMPVLGGIDTIKEVRALEDSGVLREHCPFIAVTANARQEQIQEMLEAGMDDSMPKPFRFDALLSKMKELLGRLGKAPLVPENQSALGTLSPSLEAKPYAEEPSSASTSDSTAVTSSVMLRHYRISNLWSDDSSVVTTNAFHVILLNTPPPRSTAVRIWTNASHQSNVLKVCADGATDRLHTQVYDCKLEDLDSTLQPDVVIGDLDSITQESRTHYENAKGTQVLQIDDQNSTDFTKAVKFIDSQSDDLDIVVIGGIGGRLDQTFSTLNTLTQFPGRRIYMVDQDNLIILLCTGKHEIDCTGLGRHCGLVPLCGPVKCWSTGLQWCLNGETMDIGGLISTNNRVISEDAMVGVTCDAPVLFSIEMRK